MKKFVTTLAVLGMAIASYAQGTIAFGNTIASRVQYKSSPSAAPVNLPTTVAAVFGVFWGTSADNLRLNDGAPGNLGVSSTSNAGIIVAPGTYQIAGSDGSGDQTVFMQIRGWDASFGANWQAAQQAGALFGETDIRQVRLAATLGPGTAIWQGSTGTDPAKFRPITLTVVPEPSTIALGVLGLGSLLFLRRRK